MIREKNFVINAHAKKRKRIIASILIFTLAVLTCLWGNAAIERLNTATDTIELEEGLIMSESADLPEWRKHSLQELAAMRTLCRDSLVYEVTLYVIKKQPHFKVSPLAIVEECLKYDFDLPLCLSQALQESSFGYHTGGTNSVFGVADKRYSSCNASIAPYIKLIKTKYMKNRSVEQLLSAGFNVEGSSRYRYAGDPNYSRTIASHRNGIIKHTNIYKLQSRLRDINEYIALRKSYDARQREIAIKDSLNT